MTRLLQIMAAACLGFIAAGFAMETSDTLFLLADGSQYYQYVRYLLIGILAMQILTIPPRYLAFRILSGMVSIGTALWVIGQTYYSAMPILDTVSMAAAACVIGVTTLELQLSISGSAYGQGQPKIFSRQSGIIA